MPPTCKKRFRKTQTVSLTTRASLPILLQLSHDRKSTGKRRISYRAKCLHLQNLSLPVHPWPALLRAYLHEEETKRWHYGRGAIWFAGEWRYVARILRRNGEGHLVDILAISTRRLSERNMRLEESLLLPTTNSKRGRGANVLFQGMLWGGHHYSALSLTFPSVLSAANNGENTENSPLTIIESNLVAQLQRSCMAMRRRWTSTFPGRKNLDEALRVKPLGFTDSKCKEECASVEQDVVRHETRFDGYERNRPSLTKGGLTQLNLTYLRLMKGYVLIAYRTFRAEAGRKKRGTKSSGIAELGQGLIGIVSSRPGVNVGRAPGIHDGWRTRAWLKSVW